MDVVDYNNDLDLGDLGRILDLIAPVVGASSVETANKKCNDPNKLDNQAGTVGDQAIYSKEIQAPLQHKGNTKRNAKGHRCTANIG